VFTTGDDEHISTELYSHDKVALAGVKIPDDWRPQRSLSLASHAHRTLENLVAEVLKDGSPFDDPLPDVILMGTTFCFSGAFEFGTRRQCQEAVTSRGGAITENINLKTDVLVIGNDPNPNWAYGSYGNKISAAMMRKLRYSKPLIISELYWQALLE
jgi:NAD-dependent DNA ligase